MCFHYNNENKKALLHIYKKTNLEKVKHIFKIQNIWYVLENDYTDKFALEKSRITLCHLH